MYCTSKYVAHTATVLKASNMFIKCVFSQSAPILPQPLMNRSINNNGTNNEKFAVVFFADAVYYTPRSREHCEKSRDDPRTTGERR